MLHSVCNLHLRNLSKLDLVNLSILNEKSIKSNDLRNISNIDISTPENRLYKPLNLDKVFSILDDLWKEGQNPSNEPQE